jgi:hypothetical protein
MKASRFALLAATALCGGALFVEPGAAMPVGKLGAALDVGAARAQNVAFACGPFRCWWRPNYYAAPLYGPAYVIPYTSGPGWYGGWRRPWYGGRYRRAWW